jgi:hypothetical protein
MIDLMSATQAAVFGALDDRVTLAPVHDHVKQDTDPPFVKIGTIETISEGGKDEQAETLQVEVHTIYRGADRSALLAIMHEVREALEGQTITAPDASFWTPTFIGAVASEAGPDGVTYAGISTFEVFAEPA